MGPLLPGAVWTPPRFRLQLLEGVPQQILTKNKAFSSSRINEKYSHLSCIPNEAANEAMSVSKESAFPQHMDAL